MKKQLKPQAESKIAKRKQVSRLKTADSAVRTSEKDPELAEQMKRAAGILTGFAGHHEAGLQLLNEVEKVIRPIGSESDEKTFLRALDSVAALAPKNPIEGVLAADLLSIHAMSQLTVSRFLTAKTVGESEVFAARAEKLLRLEREFLETIARMRGLLSSQRMVIERVDVATGAQAIVGAFGHGVGGGTDGQY
jgi:hypothetical protein